MAANFEVPAAFEASGVVDLELGKQGEAFGAEVEGEGSLAEVEHLGEEEEEVASGLLDVVEVEDPVVVVELPCSCRQEARRELAVWSLAGEPAEPLELVGDLVS